MNNISKTLAEKVNMAGGKAYYVGGYVRDRIQKTENKDIDIEVHGLTPDELYNILKTIGNPLSYGESFGVYSLEGEDVDIAMPRKEKATGKGHRDFQVSVDPFLGVKKAAERRDFTVNALMEDILTGEIIDSFGGLKDLEEGIIRHVNNESFSEDPLRVLRACQFASRFGFEIAPETMELCGQIDISQLSKERVDGELRKAMLKGKKPSVFFEALRAMGQLHTWFPELEKLIGLEQDPIFHPEGDVWTHSMEVIDRGAKYRKQTQNPYGFMLLCLTHDFGKITTSEEINGRIHAYKHEVEGFEIAEPFLKRLMADHDIIGYVKNMLPLHMKPNVIAFSKAKLKTSNRMFDEAKAPRDLIYFAMCDRPVKSGNVDFTGDSDFLFERLKVYEEIMSKPFVRGKDLIDAGLTPGPEFGEILAYSHKLRLADIEKEIALKQTLSYARQILEKTK